MFRVRKAAAAKQDTSFRPLSYEDARPMPVDHPANTSEIPSPEAEHSASFIDPVTAEPLRNRAPGSSDSEPLVRPDVMTQMEMTRRYAVEAYTLPDGVRPVAPLATSPTEITEANATRLHIGSALRMKANVEVYGVIQVDGHLEASAHCEELNVAASGTLIGDITAGTPEILGKFEGSLTITGKLIIRATGSIAGTIKYGSIEIESGGHISGDIQSLPEKDAQENVAPENDKPTGRAAAFVGPQRPEPETTNNPPQLNLSEFRRDRSDTPAGTPGRPAAAIGDQPSGFSTADRPDLSF
jgi:cytoskeletal protein CcmA (bactofilin family)